MPHSQMEDQLGKYCGLILYMKEMDEERYRKLCAVSVVSGSLIEERYTDRLVCLLFGLSELL